MPDRKLTVLPSRLLAVALMAAVALSALGVTAASALQSSTGKLAFIAYGMDNNADVYVADADGSNPQKITATSGKYSDIAWSPDGTKVAYVDHFDDPLKPSQIKLINADGSSPVTFSDGTTPDFGPTWSPDGTQIAFSSQRNHRQDVYVANIDGSNARGLTTTFFNNADTPVWSPDGKQIAFFQWSDASPGRLISTMNSDGSNGEVVTLLPAIGSPVWSPDGTKIAFSADSPIVMTGEVFIMNANGTGLHVVSEPINPDYPRNSVVQSWSPDGSKLLFLSDRDAKVQAWQQMYTMNTDGSNIQVLALDFTDVQSAAWSPK